VYSKKPRMKTENVFSKQIIFKTKFNCILQVSAEILEVEKFDEPMQKHIIDLISELGITKLVVGFSFMKPSMYVDLHSLLI